MKKTLCILLSTFALFACENGAPQQTTSPSTPTPQASNVPTYHVLTERNYLPFIMHVENGDVSGFDYDVLTAIAQKQNIKLTFEATLWDKLFPALAEGKADIVSSGISINEERKQTMTFSEPYFVSETALLVGKDSNIQTPADIANKKITAQSGTSHAATLESMSKKLQSHNLYDSAWLPIKDVLTNEADATLGDSGAMNYYAQQYQKDGVRVIVLPEYGKEELGFAVKKDNLDLKKQLDDGLAAIKADGTYQTIHKKWFGY